MNFCQSDRLATRQLSFSGEKQMIIRLNARDQFLRRYNALDEDQQKKVCALNEKTMGGTK